MDNPQIIITKKFGNENMRKAKKPPQNEAVAYIDVAIKTCVEVGPGIDWQIAIN